MAEVTVSRYVARRRAELGLDKVQVTVPQDHAPGAEAEVDFGDFHAVIAGVLVKLWMFVMRLSCSGRAFHVAFATQAQEAFLEGHVQALEYFGAVPGRVRYDNLKPAVVRVLRGRDRAESERFIALRSHYGFDSFFCTPGPEGAHEKGGVEGEIGRFRRRHLVPVPAVASLAALNQFIAAAGIVDDGRVITGRPVTIAAAFAEEQLAMGPLPAEPFDPARLLAARVDARARVCVRQNYYSFPARYAGRRLPVRLSASSVEVLDGPQVVARHERAAGKYAEILVLDHYLEILRRKPGAPPGALADFNTDAVPAITPGQLAHLATGAYLDKGEPVVLLGDSGTGKTHLLIGLGLACEQGRRVRYVTTAALVNELVEAADQRALSRVFGRYGRLDLLLLDELGYVQVDPRGAELVFQIITERDERASIAIGTNLPFSKARRLPRPAAGRRDRRPGHLQRPHPRDRHPVLPARHQQNQPAQQPAPKPGP